MEISLETLMNTTPETLAEKQYYALLEHSICILNEVISALRFKDFDKIRKLISESLAGDSYGDYNCYINFGYDGREMDIYDVINKLSSLLVHMKGE